MFSGAISVNLDSKGRMAIPTRYREFLSEGMVCTIGLYHPCLTLYSLSEWQQIEKQLSTLSSVVEAERRIKRLLLGYATECPMDSAGRILLPPTLRTYAKLEKHTMFVGQSNKFEIWDEAIWYQQISDDIAAISADVENLSDNLKNLTI
ncbi:MULTISPECIES: division/cell wall cluster transcriptional repressor MraZ [unclassified Gilliamella]|uniref:division/cell wall cluster transcriptional repressor MraZ n=1 Tax=unclassified Gilliamella TaxID=2685620 RepID=UPI001C6A36EA|nr:MULTISPECIES: division/cell wall cluster transcriptional repressor MraZ [unclassified Gilliamella]MCX8600398.1 division/cell wall cluster transcriptional repressor MraZ [Gilliamella sp. B3722]MCX8609394.1 division/cell wall cluster transcriptional repressor MraZ [Gilliamella sp. B3771]MCX8609613.1 division/cell wall cluster transcriptional repressor MraZ [Gilliamella sp. B3891]MCX8612298.1 division/cell wall cluster transcriptional repressor MraZ [Gilliamella sp. B3773]MCX8615718.1 division